MTIVMDVKRCMKATLLAIIILSVVTWLSHIYSCIKTFMESLPSVVSGVIAPKCLFIFTNIIVVFLVSESKLSRRRSKLRKNGVDAAARDEDMPQDRHHQKQEEVLLTEVLLPAIIGESKEEQENKMAMVLYQEKDAPIGSKDLNRLVVVDDERESSVVDDGVRVNQYGQKFGHLVLHSVGEVQEEVQKGQRDFEFDLQQEVSEYAEKERAAEELEDWDLPPADELNRRVEDFIARFNMERQLEEAKMLVCCY